MDSALDRIIKAFEEQLGPNWKVTSHNVFNVVYYFDCEINGQHYLTSSYGVYPETNIQEIIKKEVDRIKAHYRQFQQAMGYTA